MVIWFKNEGMRKHFNPSPNHALILPLWSRPLINHTSIAAQPHPHHKLTPNQSSPNDTLIKPLTPPQPRPYPTLTPLFLQHISFVMSFFYFF